MKRKPVGVQIKGLIDDLILPMEEKIMNLENGIKCRQQNVENLSKQLKKARAVMTVKQRCQAFQEQCCHECDDFECGDNTNKDATVKHNRDLAEDLQRCRTAMTIVQRCHVFGETNCTQCEEIACDNNRNKSAKINLVFNKSACELLDLNPQTIAMDFTEKKQTARAVAWFSQFISECFLIEEGSGKEAREHMQALGNKIDKITNIVDAAGTTKGIPLENRVEHIWKRSVSCGASGQQVAEINEILNAAGVDTRANGHKGQRC